MLGQIGLPGGGVGFGYAAANGIGAGGSRIAPPSLTVPPNPVKAFIPVARIADMLENPGAAFDYNGQRLTYPDARIVYWCGGNPNTLNRFAYEHTSFRQMHCGCKTPAANGWR